ncbi:MAG TPA: amidohydrolase family protein [Phycisphaerae bacterium]|nr:amidohydrolase family protein [Phycisphaerae bacterium]
MHRRIQHLGLATVAALWAMSNAGLAMAGDDRTPATYAVRAKRIYTMADGDTWFVDNGLMLVRDGKIAAIGADIVPPAYTKIIDLGEAVIAPGFVLANSTIVPPHSAPDSVGPQYRAIDAFNPYLTYDRVIAGGVTTAYLNPGNHRLVSGQGAVVKLGAEGDAAILRDDGDLVINLGERAFDPPSIQHWLVPPSSDNVIRPSDVQRPNSRMGQLLELSEWFDRALAGPALTLDDDDAIADDALRDLLRRKVPLRIVADRAIDIEEGLDFANQQRHHCILTGGREIMNVADAVKSTGAAIVLEFPANPRALFGDLGPGPDVIEDDLEVPAVLRDAMIAVAPPAGAPHADLLYYAGALKAAGLSQRNALAAITSNAARILGVDDRVGQLVEGRDADFVVLGDDPFTRATRVTKVFVDGRLEFDGASLIEGTRVLVRAGHVWMGDHWQSPGAVYVENGRVRSAGPTASSAPFTQVIDAGDDAYVTPGFIDARGHLGLEGDRSAAGADVSIASILYNALPEFHRVAEAGVTTVMTSAYRPGGEGARIAAIHTAGENPDELVVRETAGVLISVRGADAKSVEGRLKGLLGKAKKYDDAWKKYEKELAEYQSKDKKTPETKPAEEEKKKDDNVVVEKPKEDPLTGTWEGEVAGAPLPEPQKFTAKLKLDGDKVSGSFATFFGGGEEIEVKGTFKDKHLDIELELDVPIGKPSVTADLDKPDHMIGQFKIGSRFSFDLEADRTERAVPEIKIKRRRKKKDTEGPQAPPKDASLEPYRALFAGEIAMVVEVEEHRAIEAAIGVLTGEFKVPFVLLNANEANQVAETIVRAKTGVIVRTNPNWRVDDREYVQAPDLSMSGIPIAYQSDAEDGARHLPLRAMYDIQYGLDPTAALSALTGDAARLLKMENDVGYFRPGCRGDFLIFNGPPLAPGSRLERVFVNGKEVLP